MKLKDILESKKSFNPTTEDNEYYMSGANWPIELEAAKEFAREAVSTFKFKEKIPKFNRQIDQITRIDKLQSLIINALLSGEGNSVIR